MTALDLDTVRNVALALVGVFVVGSVISAVLLKTIAQKLAVASIFALLAILVWSQRTSLENCADIVRASVVASDAATCSFFGREVDIPLPSPLSPRS